VGLAFVPAGSRLPSWSWWIGVVVSSWKGWRHNSNERKVIVMPLCPFDTPSSERDLPTGYEMPASLVRLAGPDTGNLGLIG
jgi:hypothetical protein